MLRRKKTSGIEGNAGRQAVKNGKYFELETVQNIIREGYLLLQDMPSVMTEPFIIHQWKKSGLTTLVKTRLQPDIVVWHPVKHPEKRLIELKWQETPGSTNKKVFMDIHTLLATNIPSIVVLCGPSWDLHYIDFYRGLACDKLMVITSTDEFRVRINRGLF